MVGDSKKALDMIPANTKYVETEGKLVQVVRIDGEARILKLRHETQSDALVDAVYFCCLAAYWPSHSA